jgi:hypothetical protein
MPVKPNKNALSPPPNATDPSAIEVLRIWAIPGEAQQVSMITAWQEPGTWGLLLADVARHAAKAYAYEGLNEHATLSRIVQFLQAELMAPTVEARRL